MSRGARIGRWVAASGVLGLATVLAVVAVAHGEIGRPAPIVVAAGTAATAPSDGAYHEVQPTRVLPSGTVGGSSTSPEGPNDTPGGTSSASTPPTTNFLTGTIDPLLETSATAMPPADSSTTLPVVGVPLSVPPTLPGL